MANNWSTSTQNFGGRMAFDRDGLLYLTVGDRMEQERAQKTGDHGGKVLRLRDDGSVPPDNPFVGKAGYTPEIYSLGHRSEQGLALNPATGAIWENEHGPQGGDELNIILAGRNYGWPLVTFGINYNGENISDATWRADLEPPFIYWVPSIAVSGLSFYTGDRFPGWKGNVFVGSMFMGRTRATGHIQRVVLNEKGLPVQREPLLTELKQRIRDVRPGPDGLLYVLTEEDSGALLKIEPAALDGVQSEALQKQMSCRPFRPARRGGRGVAYCTPVTAASSHTRAASPLVLERPADAEPGDPRVDRREHVTEARARLVVPGEDRRRVVDVEHVEQAFELAAEPSGHALRRTAGPAA